MVRRGDVMHYTWRRCKRDKSIGAGERNRTAVISLEGCCSTIELHPQLSFGIIKHIVINDVVLQQ